MPNMKQSAKKYDINISNINLIFRKYPTIRIISDQNIFYNNMDNLISGHEQSSP